MTEPVQRADYVPADALARKPHKKGCHGDLYRLPETITVDRLGRKGNGGWVAHEYVCNMRWDGCKARILLTERAVRRLAVAAHWAEEAESARARTHCPTCQCIHECGYVYLSLACCAVHGELHTDGTVSDR